MCGGNGNDRLTGGNGADHFGGGSGTDTAPDFNAAQGEPMGRHPLKSEGGDKEANTERAGALLTASALSLALIHRSAWNRYSRKFISKIPHSPAPIPPISPLQTFRRAPTSLELVRPMDRYAGLRILP